MVVVRGGVVEVAAVGGLAAAGKATGSVPGSDGQVEQPAGPVGAGEVFESSGVFIDQGGAPAAGGGGEVAGHLGGDGAESGEVTRVVGQPGQGCGVEVDLKLHGGLRCAGHVAAQ